MKIVLCNCNNIDSGSIEVEENRLNIKYAMNGTGKSTIAKAMELHSRGNNAIRELLPFKHLYNTEEQYQPHIEGMSEGMSVAVFNDSYINQFVFRPDEVIANSFEIFVKSKDYDKHIDEIEKIICDIKDTFKDSQELDQIIADLINLSDGFGKSKTGYSAAGSIGKGLSKGNKLENIPKGLESYSAYLKCGTNVQWLKWQLSGNEFIDITTCCPYCTSPTNDKRETILQVSKEYDAKAIEHLVKVISVIENLKKYFTSEIGEKLALISKNAAGLSKEEINYLLQIKEQVDLLKDKLVSLKGLTFFSFNDVDKVLDIFNSLRIDLKFLPAMDSVETNRIIQIINESIDVIITKAGKLQGEINQQKLVIQRTIKEYNDEINKFLKNAGYKYFVDVELDKETYKMRLKHKDSSQSVSNGSQHLSYGEKNAFSLVLFMYGVLAKNPDVIILDDPISSFDKNKKYAIIDMLFRRKKSLKNKTVLMMTHDLEPIVDILYNLPHKFEPIPRADFIASNDGIITEIPITRNDLNTFGQICEDNIALLNNDIIKLIYLRRYHEITSNKGMTYQLLSNLFKKRESPFKVINMAEVAMTAEEISAATLEIRKKVPAFDYNTNLVMLKDQDGMLEIYKAAKLNYEKLQIFRIITGETLESDVINKFINETFHIENEYIMQLNPCKYETIPSYIIDECTQTLCV